jgi:hypothetical protein
MERLGLKMEDINVKQLGLPEVLNRLAVAGFDSGAAYRSLETRAAAAFLVLKNNRKEILEQIIAQNELGGSAEGAARGQNSFTAEWQRSMNIINKGQQEALEPAEGALKKLLKGMNDYAADPVWQKLRDNYNEVAGGYDIEAEARALDTMTAYREEKEALIGVLSEYADEIDRTTTAANEATDAVNEQRTKVEALDGAMTRVGVRSKELSTDQLALQAEVATLTGRFEGWPHSSTEPLSATTICVRRFEPIASNR